MLLLIKLVSSQKKDKTPYLILSFLFVPVIVFSHPGTPIFLILILSSMLILCKKVRDLRFLSVFIFLIITFISYNYYQSIYSKTYINYVDRFFDALFSGQYAGTTERFVTTIPSRIIFLLSRIEITIFSFVFGLLGIYFLNKRGYKNEAGLFIAWAFSMVLFTIFVSLSLKGEYYERLVLISSLPLAAVGAYFLEETKVSGRIILIILLLTTPLYFVAKYGNEAFESISLEKLRVDCFSNNFYDNCDEKQEIVNSAFNYDVKSFGYSYYTVSREVILVTSVYQSMEQDKIKIELEKIIADKKLDRIYSSNKAAAYI